MVKFIIESKTIVELQLDTDLIAEARKRANFRQMTLDEFVNHVLHLHMVNYRTLKITIEGNTLKIKINHGRKYRINLSSYPELRRATLDQMRDVQVMGDNKSLYFPTLGLDVEVDI